MQIGIRDAQNSDEGWTFSLESGMRVDFRREFTAVGGGGGAVPPLTYRVQATRRGGPDEAGEEVGLGFGAWIAHWRNVFWVFALFLAYLLALPWLGMLVGGMAFVFLLLNALGGWSPDKLALHAVIAVVSIGGMWSIFTFGLGVLLPRGDLFGWF